MGLKYFVTPQTGVKNFVAPKFHPGPGGDKYKWLLPKGLVFFNCHLEGGGSNLITTPTPNPHPYFNPATPSQP